MTQQIVPTIKRLCAPRVVALELFGRRHGTGHFFNFQSGLVKVPIVILMEKLGQKYGTVPDLTKTLGQDRLSKDSQPGPYAFRHLCEDATVVLRSK